MEFSGERFILGYGGMQIALEHWHRYLIAEKYCKNKAVLDIACGAGYGSHHLAKTAKHVTGVDISEESIEYARGKYRKDNLDYLTGSVENIPVADTSIDVIVSFETIEHIAADLQKCFMEEARRVLKHDGILIISTPDKLYYTDKKGDKNHFHIKEFYESEFVAFLNSHFKYVSYAKQSCFFGSYIHSLSHTSAVGLDGFALHKLNDEIAPRNENINEFDYLVAVCSDNFIEPLSSSFAADVNSEYLEELKSEQGFFSTLYIDRGEGYNEHDSLVIYDPQEKSSLEFDISTSNDAISMMFAPLKQAVVIKVHSVTLVTRNGQELSTPFKALNANYSNGDADYFAHERPCYDIHFGSPSIIDSADKLIIRAHYITTGTKNVHQMLVDTTMKCLHSKSILAKIFIDQGEGFSEDNSIYLYNPHLEEKCVFDLHGFKNIRYFRFDPLEQPGIIRINRAVVILRNGESVELHHKAENADFSDGALDYFLHDDPVYHLFPDNPSVLQNACSIEVHADYVCCGSENVLAALRDKKTHTRSAPSLITTSHPQIETHTRKSSHDQLKLIAFYLPQFHSIPENDAWWGKGFTEWTNVVRATPQFEGHYQPHEPADLGYYDLRDPNVQLQQIALAKKYGVSAFCFYFYWFHGKTLLEDPVRQYLDNLNYDLPFCLCWANENWTRRWDGRNNDILIAQEHSPKDDIDFISYISKYLKDSRYIRVDGKPLLLMYRPALLPNASETANRWRAWCRNNGIGEIYLVCTQSFEAVDPEFFGFDAATEFPPNLGTFSLITNTVKPINQHFQGKVLDWRAFVNNSRSYVSPPYKLFRGVCPSWDNEARRTGQGTVFFNSSPALYQEWLRNACTDTFNRFSNTDEQLVFINAWNEWAEGAHLEPDQRFGHAWLKATQAAVMESKLAYQQQDAKPKIIVVTHDAHTHGAQYLALKLVKTLVQNFGYHVDIVLLGWGLLTEDFARLGVVHSLAGVDSNGAKGRFVADLLAQKGHKNAIVNSTVSGLFLGILSNRGIRCIALVHELESIIKSYKLEHHAEVIASNAAKIVFPAHQVADNFRKFAPFAIEKQRIRPQGLFRCNRYKNNQESARVELRQKLEIPPQAFIVLSVGFADFRKGVDLFVEIALKTIAISPNVYFVWVGHWDQAIITEIGRYLKDKPLANNIIFTGRRDPEHTEVFYAGADIYALTSREDPFPSVVAESLEVGVPVLGFKNAGGFNELIDQGCGMLIDPEDTSAFASTIVALISATNYRISLGKKGAQLIRQRFSFRHYTYDLLEYLNSPIKRVSVIVPNYNYAEYLRERLRSIIEQTYPIFEIIILDDASTDNSLEIIDQCLSETDIDSSLHINSVNSNSVFTQWQRGVELAKGDLIWICEADDIADIHFLERCTKEFQEEQVVLCYTQSRQIDSAGVELDSDYRAYTDDISGTKWRTKYVNDGRRELGEGFAVKNTIPNVSGVLFKASALREALSECMDELDRLKIAGDWAVYAHLLQKGKIAYLPESLNLHRRHNSSATNSSQQSRHLAEIIYLQHKVSKNSSVDIATSEKAKAYIRKIYGQFRLDPAFIDNPEANPDVMQWLKHIQHKV